MSEYKITIEYYERTEYEIKIGSDGYAYAGDVYDHYENDPKYLVREIEQDEDGKVWSNECLDEFETYQEAVDYVKELEGKTMSGHTEEDKPIGVITFLDGSEEEFYSDAELNEQKKPIAMVGYY